MQRPKRSKAFFPAVSSNESATVISAGGRCLDRASAAPIEPGGVDRDFGSSYTAEFFMKAPLTCESLSSSYYQTASSPPRPNPETFRSLPGPKQRAHVHDTGGSVRPKPRPRSFQGRGIENPRSGWQSGQSRQSKRREARLQAVELQKVLATPADRPHLDMTDIMLRQQPINIISVSVSSRSG